MSSGSRTSSEGSESYRALTAARKALRLRLERHPRIAAPVGEMRRTFRLVLFRVRARLADARSGDPYFEAGRLFETPVSGLRRRAGLPYGYMATKHPAAVVPGDWDQPPTTILETPYWSEFRAALRGEQPWESTAAYHSVMAPAETETSEWRRRVMTTDGRRVIRGYQSLYESMRSTGCLSQAELAKRRGLGYRPTNTDDISVAVGRDGELLLCQGGHRVETARALGIETVPVWVGVRHPGWWALRRRILTYAAAHGGRVPEPLLHPDLDNIPYRCDCGARYEMVRSVLQPQGGVVVDLSPGWGYFLHRLEQDGYHCAGVFARAEDAYFLERLRIAGDRHFALMHPPEFGGFVDRERVSVLLLLRSLEWWVADDDAKRRLVEFVSRSRPLQIFLEGPPELSSGAAGASETMDEAVRLLAKAMCSAHVEVLGRPAESDVYLLTDEGSNADDRRLKQ